MKRVAVILMNLGGPNHESAVQPFLYNLFMDEDIIKIPLKGKMRSILANFIATRRAKTVAEKYKEINACPKGCTGPKTCQNRVNGIISDCCSPINPATERQRAFLQKRLNQETEGVEYEVISAMRYWKPSTPEALALLDQGDFDEVVLLPLYPQFSYTTTASGFNEWTRELQERGWEDRWKTHIIVSYHLHPKYIEAISQRIDEKLAELPADIREEVQLVFSAHGTPVSERESGDPYSFQIKETMEAVMEYRGKDLPYWLSYQSRVGPVKWLLPNTEKFIEVLRGYGMRHMVLIPIAFVSDHIETMHEIGIEFKEIADEIGIKTFEFTTGLNHAPNFIEALADEVEKKVKTMQFVP